MIHGVRNVEERTRPLAGLLKEMLPRDGTVVIAGEPRAAHIFGNAIVNTPNHSPVHRKAHTRREIAFGGAERHVGATGIAPL